jgi:AcrR family transcriptional regulator
MTSNAERSASTQARLVAVARALFAEHGYAGTGTEAILEGAGVRRGALYHHYADKAALFEAVCMALSAEAAAAIETATSSPKARQAEPLDVLVRGSVAWIEFTTRPEVRRILIIDAPTVLGWARWEALDRRLGHAALRQGIEAAVQAKAIRCDCSIDMLATMVNGALNALALKVGAPGAQVAPREWRRAVRSLFFAFASPAATLAAKARQP